jgi:hypothetical protein
MRNRLTMGFIVNDSVLLCFQGVDCKCFTSENDAYQWLMMQELVIANAAAVSASNAVRKDKYNVVVGGDTYSCLFELLLLCFRCIEQSIVLCNLVDPASSHMLVSKIKPCKSKY